MATGRQHIPRPEQWHPGPGAPWQGRDVSILSDLDEVLRRLRLRLASGAGQSDFDVGGPATRPSAVLVPILDVSGVPSVVLTRRSQNLTHHRGEVSFPGGRLDPGEDAVSAALREAHEEISLAPSDVTVVGALAPVTTYASNSEITPVVGHVRGSPRFAANADEVERVFTVPLGELASPGVFTQELWPIGGTPSAIHFYDLADDILWGVTGRMVTGLLDLLTRP